jgi:hypothetical protein
VIIERALEKARQKGMLEAERRKAEGQAAAPAAPAAAPPRPAIRPASYKPESRPVFDRIDLDAEVCESNRILLADSEKNHLARAEPAFRLLRSRAKNAIATGNWSSVGVTSPGPGEGKTVMTLNLALSFAREKQREVFVLDLDMRNPSILKYVGAAPTVPISDYFQGTARPEQVLMTTGIEDFIVAGNRDPIDGASELLAGQKLDELLAYIQQISHGALVMIDLPPVTSTDEALQVGSRVDAMFLVVSEGMTRRDSLARTVGLLSDCRVAGIIVNRSTENRGRDYDYYYRY